MTDEELATFQSCELGDKVRLGKSRHPYKVIWIIGDYVGSRLAVQVQRSGHPDSRRLTIEAFQQDRLGPWPPVAGPLRKGARVRVKAELGTKAVATVLRRRGDDVWIKWDELAPGRVQGARYDATIFETVWEAQS